MASAEEERLLTPTEVATMFHVDPRTATRWAQAGRIPRVFTPGGHTRFREYDVRAAAAGQPLPERGPDGRVIERPDEDATGDSGE